jgi:creatinine amidohydrolase
MNGIFSDTMADMNWAEIKAQADKRALILLPLGVLEEHGPHLCLGTDIYTAHQHCVAVRKRLLAQGYACVIAPPFYWGICQSTGGFIGSFAIRKETAKALLIDILLSLNDFGFEKVFGVNAHGDIEHSIVILEAFKEASAARKMQACYAFDENRLVHFGLTGAEPYLCPVKPQTISVSFSSVPDVHGGDVETATIHHFYPGLADIEKAKTLPPVALPEERGMDWLFGGHIRELSAQGYLGDPAAFESVKVQDNIDDYANRIMRAIMDRLSI